MVWKGFLYIFRAGHTDFGVGGPKEGGGQGSVFELTQKEVTISKKISNPNKILFETQNF